MELDNCLRSGREEAKLLKELLHGGGDGLLKLSHCFCQSIIGKQSRTRSKIQKKKKIKNSMKCFNQQARLILGVPTDVLRKDGTPGEDNISFNAHRCHNL